MWFVAAADVLSSSYVYVPATATGVASACDFFFFFFVGLYENPPDLPVSRRYTILAMVIVDCCVEMMSMRLRSTAALVERYGGYIGGGAGDAVHPPPPPPPPLSTARTKSGVCSFAACAQNAAAGARRPPSRCGGDAQPPPQQSGSVCGAQQRRAAHAVCARAAVCVREVRDAVTSLYKRQRRIHRREDAQAPPSSGMERGFLRGRRHEKACSYVLYTTGNEMMLFHMSCPTCLSSHPTLHPFWPKCVGAGMGGGQDEGRQEWENRGKVMQCVYGMEAPKV